MTDISDERRSIPPPVAARPKGAASPSEQMEKIWEPEKRGPGRPPKPDAFTILRVIAVELEPLDKAVRRQVLETLLALSE